MTGKRQNFSELAAAFVFAMLLIALQWQRNKSSLEPASALSGASSIKPGVLPQEAASPADIPPKGWWLIIKRTAVQASENDLLSQAAAVTFYGLLGIFPAVTAMVSLYGLLADPQAIADHLDALSGIIPGGGMDIIEDQVKHLVDSPPAKLGVGALIGLATAIWSANQGSKAFFSALNVVYGEKERRSFIVLTAQSLAFTVGAMIFILLALLAVIGIPIILSFIGLTSDTTELLALTRWPLILVVTVFFLACLYRFGPSRAKPKWRWVTWGSVLSALAWVGLSAGFSWYVEHFGNYNKTYGSLGAAIGFMTWIWLSTTVMLIGAQLNAETEAQGKRTI
jgi:membrane protein